MTDASGQTNINNYDAIDRQTTVTDALGQTMTMVYDRVGNVIASIEENGNTTRYSYDNLNRQTTVTDALGQTMTMVYDKVGNLIASIDENGNANRYTYDAIDRLLTEIDAEAQVYRYSYDAVGNLIQSSDPLDRQTRFEYDALNRLIREIDAELNSTTYTYDGVGNLIALTNARNHTTTFTYDALNREILEIGPLGQTFTSTYDAVGNLISFSDPLGRTTNYIYDPLDRLITEVDPSKHTNSYTYDAVGNLLTFTDGNNNTTTYTYDALNREIISSDPLNQITRRAYDAVGNLISITDPELNTTTFTFDSLYRLVSETNQLNLTRFYDYDAVGNLLRYTDRNNRITTFNYDKVDRLLTETWVSSTNQPLNTINYQYDAASQLISVNDNFSSYTYDYDLVGNVIQVNNLGTPGSANVILNYRYDEVYNLIEITDSFNNSLQGTETLFYDPLDRLTKITQTGLNLIDKQVEMSYDIADQLREIRRFNGVNLPQGFSTSTYDFDLSSRLERITHNNSTGAIATYNYTYDPGDRLRTYNGTLLGLPPETSTYDYDTTDQLIDATHTNQTNESYSYDQNGNRTNIGYSTGADNRLQTDGINTYTYDNEGNILTQTAILTGEVTTYTWDYRNRLTNVVVTDAAGTVIRTVDYAYDTLDRRLAKTVDLDGAGLQTATTQRFIYQGDNIHLVFDGAGNLAQRFLFGPGVDQVLAQESNNNVLWSLEDHLGSIRTIIDPTGTVLNQITYDSFGQIVNQTDPNLDFRFSYTGREFDSETQLYYNRARYYNPAIGRFISIDPIGFEAGDVNLYRYVNNSPTNFTDPSGKFIFGFFGRVIGSFFGNGDVGAAIGGAIDLFLFGEASFNVDLVGGERSGSASNTFATANTAPSTSTLQSSNFSVENISSTTAFDLDSLTAPLQNSQFSLDNITLRAAQEDFSFSSFKPIESTTNFTFSVPDTRNSYLQADSFGIANNVTFSSIFGSNSTNNGLYSDAVLQQRLSSGNPSDLDRFISQINPTASFDVAGAITVPAPGDVVNTFKIIRSLPSLGPLVPIGIVGLGIFGFSKTTADATLAGNLRSIASSQSIEAAQQFYLNKSPTQREIIRNNLSSEEITKYGLNLIDLNPSFGGIEITAGDFIPIDSTLTSQGLPGFNNNRNVTIQDLVLGFPGNAANLGFDSNDLGGFDLYSAPIFGPSIGNGGAIDPNLEKTVFEMGIPRKDGAWSGTPGDSDWHSTKPAVNKFTGGEPIPYKGGFPNFNKWSQFDVDIQMKGNRTTDFSDPDKAFAKAQGWLKPDGTPYKKKAEDYRIKNKLTWHHNQNRKTMQLVPRGIHNNVPHSGGVSEIKKRGRL
ncbi:MAG: RHS repeat-associated core domain-containing protein [Prochloraceae cyanobacterium]